MTSGREAIESAKTEFFATGIDIQNARDVARIKGYHVWPFWSGASQKVRAYEEAHAIGIRSLRDDDPMFESLVVGGVWHGLENGRSPDCTTSGLQMTDATFDFTAVGVDILRLRLLPRCSPVSTASREPTRH